jgi:hypothetical protein
MFALQGAVAHLSEFFGGLPLYLRRSLLLREPSYHLRLAAAETHGGGKPRCEKVASGAASCSANRAASRKER